MPADWQRADLEKLWLYNLHYFDDLRARDAAGRRAEQRALLERWVRENPPGMGVGWEPYPCSLRIVNWIKWALAGGELGPALEQSLALQAEHLSRHVEHHLQGNHLLANAKGLAFAGLFFSGAAAQRWLAAAVALLERQLPEQILADGGHCERSPMYHALVLEDLLDLINLSHLTRGSSSRCPAAAARDPRSADARVAAPHDSPGRRDLVLQRRGTRSRPAPQAPLRVRGAAGDPRRRGAAARGRAAARLRLRSRCSAAPRY